MKKQFTLNIAGNKIDFEIEVRHNYDSNFDFHIKTIKDNAVLMSGSYYRGKLLNYNKCQSIAFFQDKMEKKAKTALRAHAKELKIKIKL